MGVSIQRDIGDRELAGGKILVGLEVVFHHLQGGVAALHPIFQSMDLQVAAALDQRQPKIGGADIRLKCVLFEEHPLQGLGAFDPRFRCQRRAAGDIPEDGVGFRKIASFGDFQQRHLAAWILR